MKLLLIRHAETQANVDGKISSVAPGEPLTPNGHRQAEKLAADLRDVHLDAVCASSLLRAQQTADPLARNHHTSVTVINGLHEIQAGDLEGGATVDHLLGYLGPMEQWGLGNLAAAHPGAFDGHHFLARFDAAIADIVQQAGRDATVAVVTHSGCIGVWTAGRADNITPAYSAAHQLTNIDIVELTGAPKTGWHVESWGGVRLDELTAT